MVYCTTCGAQIAAQDAYCLNCGGANTARLAAVGSAKSRVTAGIFAIVLGHFGVHKFYLNKIGMGILYLCFFWTGVPTIVGIIEGIIYLTQTDQQFAVAQGVRVG